MKRNVWKLIARPDGINFEESIKDPDLNWWEPRTKYADLNIDNFIILDGNNISPEHIFSGINSDMGVIFMRDNTNNLNYVYNFGYDYTGEYVPMTTEYPLLKSFFFDHENVSFSFGNTNAVFINHKNIAYEKGATKKGLYSIMDKIIKIGSKLAINISEKN